MCTTHLRQAYLLAILSVLTTFDSTTCTLLTRFAVDIPFAIS